MVNFLNVKSVVIMPKQCKLLFLLHLCVLQFVWCEAVTWKSCESEDEVDRITVRHGDNLTLCCEVLTETITADDLKISIGETKVLSEKINDKTRKAFIRQPAVGTYTYYCTSHSTKPRIITVDVLVPPSDVEDFKCRSNNLETLNCSWIRPLDDVSNKYQLYFLFNGARRLAPVYYGEGRTMYTFLSGSSRPQYIQSQEDLQLILKAKNPLDSHEQSLAIKDHYSIVKFKGPINLKVTEISPHKAVLQWQLHHNLIHLKNVKYKIQYEIQSSKYTNTTDIDPKYFVRKIYKNTFLDEQNYSLYLPYAHTKYKVKIFVKNEQASDEFWSEPSVISITTASEKPKRHPLIPAGAFVSQLYGNRRFVGVYWKLIEEQEKCGGNFTYIVTSNDNNEIATKAGYVKLEPKSLDSLDVYIRSNNEVGSSANRSFLYIPAAKDTNLHVTSFTVLSYGNGTYDLTWLNNDIVDNYTLFWCVQDSDKICTDGIEFLQMNAHETERIINLPQTYSYRFAISANKGHRSSGMIWIKPKCELSADNLAMSQFPVNIHSIEHDESHVNMSWSLDCLYKKGVITGYNIRYCIVNPNSPCSYEYFLINDPSETTVSIPGLRSFTDYVFLLSVNTKFGLYGNRSQIVRTSQSTPSVPKIINILDITNNSVAITLRPPIHLNGPIEHMWFIVYNNKTELHREAQCTTNECKVIVKNLRSFTKYWFSVKSYNADVDLYSNVSNVVPVLTKMGSPSEITATYSNTDKTLSWQAPQITGGLLYQYEIKIKTLNDTEYVHITHDTHYVDNDQVYCTKRTYYVRAVNKDEAGILYPGDWSRPIEIGCEYIKSDTWIHPLYWIGALLSVTILIWSGYKYYKRRKFQASILKRPPKFHESLTPESDKLNKSETPMNVSSIKSIFKELSIKTNIPNKEYSIYDKVNSNYQKDTFFERLPFLPSLKNNKSLTNVIPSETLTNTDHKLQQDLSRVNFSLDKDANSCVPRVPFRSPRYPTNKSSSYVQAAPMQIATISESLSENNPVSPSSSNIHSEYVKALPTHTSDRPVSESLTNNMPVHTSFLNMPHFSANIAPLTERLTRNSSVAPSHLNVPSSCVESGPMQTSTIPAIPDTLTNDTTVKSSPLITHSGYVQAAPTHTAAGLISDISNSKPTKSKTPNFSPGYVTTLPMPTSMINHNSDMLKNNTPIQPSPSNTNSGYVQAASMPTSNVSPNSDILTNYIPMEYSPSNINSGYVQAAPMFTSNISSNSDILTNYIPMESSPSNMNSGYVQAAPMCTSTICPKLDNETTNTTADCSPSNIHSGDVKAIPNQTNKPFDKDVKSQVCLFSKEEIDGIIKEFSEFPFEKFFNVSQMSPDNLPISVAPST